MISSRVVALMLILLLFLIQNALGLIFSDKVPALVLIGVVYYGLARGPAFGFVLGVTAGVFSEIFGVGKIGYEMMALGLCGLAAGYTATAFFRENLLARVVLPAVLVYATTLFHLSATQALLNTGGVFEILKEAFVWPSILSTAFFSPILFRLFGRMTPPHGTQGLFKA